MTSLYDTIGNGYSGGRTTDPILAEQIELYLSGAESVINVGAGTGSYEQLNVPLIAVEPSLLMIQQRPVDAAPVVQSMAEKLPFGDNSFSHALVVLSLHHWQNRPEAYAEIKRIIRQRMVIVSYDPEAEGFWLNQNYFPELAAIDAGIFPSKKELESAFPAMEFHPLFIPRDCVDGFTAAYWARPEAYLVDTVRRRMSSFAKIQSPAAGLNRLRSDLATGIWFEQNKELASKTSLDAGYIIAVWDK